MAISRILVYLGATTPANTEFADAVTAFGTELARRSKTLVYGGSNEGTMTILADAVHRNGGKLIGVFTKALHHISIYPNLTQTFITEDLAERKDKMFSLADAIVAFPGSFGTWDELFDAAERIKVDVMNGRPPRPVALLNVNGYYDGIVSMINRSVNEGYTSSQFASLIHSENSVDSLFAWLDTQCE